ncbi:TetR family transcriptional regulator [Nocardioides marinquilinus]
MTETGLRERRRAQTEREIADAALTLFEEHGVEATTVGQVARAAGVSERTFFRYVAVKELAVFAGDAEIGERIAPMLADVTGDEPLLPQLEQVWAELLRGLAEGRDEQQRRMLRVRRLVRREPALRLAALRLDEERVGDLVSSLVESTGRPEPEVRLVVEVGVAVFRTSLDRWADAAERGEHTDLLATYTEACVALRRATR